MNDDVRTRLNQAAVGVGLGYVAWSIFSFIYEAPILAALCCLVVLIIGAFAGAAFHELAFLAWWFCGIFCLVGIAGLFIAGRTITGLFALFGLSVVLMIMVDTGAVRYLHNGIETPETKQAEYFANGCPFHTSYSRLDGYCHRSEYADPILLPNALYVPEYSDVHHYTHQPLPGALENIARLRQKAIEKATTTSSWNHPNGTDFVIFGIVVLGVVLYHLASLFRRPKRTVDNAQFQSAMAAYDRIGFDDPRRKEIERRVRRQLGS